LTLPNYGLEEVVDSFVVVFYQDGWAILGLGFFAALLASLFDNVLQFDGKIIL